MIEKIGHYSITNPASVYDEEAMTALELAGRTAQKVNEVIDLAERTADHVDGVEQRVEDRINEIPSEVTTATNAKVKEYLENGMFDNAIDEYAGELEARVDNLLTNVPDGSTTMDAEVIDARLGGNGKLYPTVGEASRGQYDDVDTATDDRVSVEAIRHGYRKNFNRLSMWEQGWISSETGEIGNTGSDNGVFIRSRDFIPTNVERLVAIHGIRPRIYRYYHSGGFVDVSESVHHEYAFDHSAYKYKVTATGATENMMLINTEKKPITPKDGLSILMLGERDTSTPDTVSVTASQYGYQKNYNQRHYWEQGYIFSTTGENGVNEQSYDHWAFNRFIGFIPSHVERIAINSGYKGRLFKYTLDGTFSEMVTFTTQSEALNHATNKYRVDFVPVNRVNGQVERCSDVWSNVCLMGDVESASTFARNLEFGYVPSGEYDSTKLSSCPHVPNFNANTTALEVETCFNGTCNGSSIIRRAEYDGNGHSLAVYYSTPATIDGESGKPVPTIMITAGAHGFEKSNVFGLAQFFYNLAHTNDILMRFLRSNVRFVIIPVVNKYGFDKNSYLNENGVNLNRNYDYNWTRSEAGDQYGGEAPFDQWETQIVNTVFEREKPFLWIDSHTKGKGAVEYNETMWCALCPNQDAYYNRLGSVAKHTIETMSALTTFNTFINPTLHAPCGYITGLTTSATGASGCADMYATSKGCMGMTLEGSNGGDVATFTPDVYKFNANIIGNFILNFLREYSK